MSAVQAGFSAPSDDPISGYLFGACKVMCCSGLRPFPALFLRPSPLQAKGLSPTEVSYSTAIGACAKATTAIEANSQKVFASLPVPVGGSAQPPRQGFALGRNDARRLVGSLLAL